MVVGALAPAQATAAASFVATTDCQMHQAFVAGDETAVDARLPNRYAPVRESSSGRPLLFARAIRCDAVTLDDRTAPATMASFGIVIESPDGRGCASGAPGVGSAKGDVPPACNYYTLFWLADDRRVVDWLRGGTPEFTAVYVPQLVFQLGESDPARGGAPFRFQALAPAPSPFTIEAIGRERPGELSVRAGYWFDTSLGTVRLAFSTDNLTSGDATGVVRPSRGSEMAALLGADERPYAAGYSSVAAERWAHAAYRKQLLWSTERTNSFAGTCSLQGTDTFTPPATNTRQPLDVRYDASGTCTGTLNGREVANAPVELHSRARGVDGSCPYARTTAPGQGSITFADGTKIRYTFDFRSASTEVDLDMYGERSGSADAPATFRTSRRDPNVVLQCAGEGAAQAAMDMTIRTDTPLVSGRREARKPRKRLRLVVSPKRVRAGRRATFAFRVRTLGRRRVAGAIIRFAGRRVRTRHSGRARLTTTLHRAGRRRARASKLGFRSASATVVVRRR